MPAKRTLTPEQIRDCILGRITEIIEESEKRDAFQAPEVRTPRLRSALYGMMLEEFAACSVFAEDTVSRVRDALGLPVTASADEIIRVAKRIRREAGR